MLACPHCKSWQTAPLTEALFASPLWRSWRVLWRPPCSDVWQRSGVCPGDNRHGDSTVFGANTLPPGPATLFLPAFTGTTGTHKSFLKSLGPRATATMNNLRWHIRVIIKNSSQRNHVQMGRASHLPNLCAALVSQAAVHVVMFCSWTGERCAAGWSTVASSAGNKLHDHLTCGQRTSRTWCISDVRQPSHYCWQKHYSQRIY